MEMILCREVGSEADKTRAVKWLESCGSNPSDGSEAIDLISRSLYAPRVLGLLHLTLSTWLCKKVCRHDTSLNHVK